MSETLRRRVLAVHGWLLAAAIGLSVHTEAWASLGVLAVTLFNWMLWLAWTRRTVGAGPFWKPLRRTPLLILIPSVYFAGLQIWFGHLNNTPLLAMLLLLVICLATFMLAADLYYYTREPGGLLVCIAGVGALICLEGLAHEWTKTHGFADLAVYSPFSRATVPEHITRLDYPIAYPNALATVLTLFTACTFGALAGARRMGEQCFWVVVLALNFSCMLLTGSRGGLISLLFLPLGYLARQFRFGRWIAAGGAFLIVAAVGWMLRKPYARLRGSGSLLQRLHGWVVTLRIVGRSPLFGEGPGAFSREWATYGPQHGYANQFALDGIYANLLCEGGIVSLTMLSLLVISAGREVYRLLSTPTGQKLHATVYYLALGMACVLIHNLTESTLALTPVILTIAVLFGVMTALRGQELAKESTNSSSVEWRGSTYASSGQRAAR